MLWARGYIITVASINESLQNWNDGCGRKVGGLSVIIMVLSTTMVATAVLHYSAILRTQIPTIITE
jgi:hypothetical protein